MLKYNNPRLNGTVVSGTGMDHPVRPHVIVGDTKMGYVKGDLMDANGVLESLQKVKDDLTANTTADNNNVQTLSNAIDTFRKWMTSMQRMTNTSHLKDNQAVKGTANDVTLEFECITTDTSTALPTLHSVKLPIVSSTSAGIVTAVQYNSLVKDINDIKSKLSTL